jgi:sugar-specific transcriptional regulator TrmB
MDTQKSKLNSQKIKNTLYSLGLSKQETTIYLLLLNKGKLSVKNIAKQLNIVPPSLYRQLKKLVQKQLVVEVLGYPKSYKALSPSSALDSFIRQKTSTIYGLGNALINSITLPKPDSTSISLTHGKADFFSKYTEFAKGAQKEILIISIGEEVSSAIMLENRDAIKRGVIIYFIAYKYENSNQQILKSWQKMGLQVRHYPCSGFHLIVFDKQQSLLGINDPSNTNDRTGLVINSKGLSKAFSDYFFSVWSKAKNID